MENKKLLEAIGEGLTKLFFPYVEVVVHEFVTDTISSIHNPFSKRKIGDPSFLGDSVDEKKDVVGPYRKINADGSVTKSITIWIRDSNGKPSFLLCINANLANFEHVMRSLSQFMACNVEQPASLFANDWKEQIHNYVHSFMLSAEKTMTTLTREEKKNLTLALEEKGFLAMPRSRDYLGSVLGVSRATIFNYLK